MKKLFVLFIGLILTFSLFSQDQGKKDQLIYRDVKNGFYQDKEWFLPGFHS